MTQNQLKLTQNLLKIGVMKKSVTNPKNHVKTVQDMPSDLENMKITVSEMLLIERSLIHLASKISEILSQGPDFFYDEMKLRDDLIKSEELRKRILENLPKEAKP